MARFRTQYRHLIPWNPEPGQLTEDRVTPTCTVFLRELKREVASNSRYEAELLKPTTILKPVSHQSSAGMGVAATRVISFTTPMSIL